MVEKRRQEMKPLVSIGIPVTDRVDGLSLTIDSLLEQSHGKFEVLLVDDTDDEITSALCADEAGRDTRVTYVKTPVSYTHLTLPTNREV